MDTSEKQTDELSGSILEGRFEIIGLLAQGAMGKVYRAEQLGLGRSVAVKVMQTGTARSTEDFERFKREAQLTAGLDHPGIVRIHACGVMDSGEPFLVMDLLEGASLATLLARQEKFSGPRFFNLFIDVCKALACAHEQGIVHRDLKPSNIFVVADAQAHGGERAVIIDFGIAKLEAAGDQKLTRTGAVIGTSTYMSPEQCLSQSVDARSDIYSLGCVMYEVLTGQPPFQGESSYDVMYKHLNQSLSSLDALGKISNALSAVIVKCLSKQPQERYASVSELCQALERCSQESPVKGESSSGNRLALLACVLGGITLILLSAKLTSQQHEKTDVAAEPAGVRKNLPVSPRALLSSLSAGTRGQPQEVRQLVQEWLSLHDNDKLAASDRASVYVKYAQLCENVRDFNESDRYRTKAIEIDSDALSSLTQRALRAYSRELNQARYQEALDDCSQVLSIIRKQYPNEYYLQVLCLDTMTDCQEALRNQAEVRKLTDEQYQTLEQLPSVRDQYLCSAFRAKLMRRLFSIDEKRAEVLLAKAKAQGTSTEGNPANRIHELTTSAHECDNAGRKSDAAQLFVLASQQPQSNTGEKERLLTSAASCYADAAQFSKASAILDGLLAQSLKKERGVRESSAKILFQLASLAARQNKNYEAEKFLLRIFANSKNYPAGFDVMPSALSLVKELAAQSKNPVAYLTKFATADNSADYQSHYHKLLAETMLAAGDNRGARAQFEQALTSITTDDPEAALKKATLLVQLGNSYSTTGHFADALTAYRKSLELFQQVHAEPNASAVLLAIASVYRIQGEQEKAMATFEKAIAASQTRNDYAALGDAYRMMTQTQTGAQAMESLKQAEKYADLVKDKRTADKQRMGCRRLYAALISKEQSAVASKVLIKALADYEPDTLLEKLNTLVGIADLERQAGSVDAARRRAGEALAVAKKNGAEYRGFCIAALVFLAKIEMEDGKPSSAEKYLNEALALSNTEPVLKERRAGVFIWLGKCLDAQHQPARAREYVQQALETYIELDDRQHLPGTTQLLGSLYDNLGDFGQAVTAYLTAFEQYRLLGCRSTTGPQRVCLKNAIRLASEHDMPVQAEKARRQLAVLGEGGTDGQ